jgi:transcriptional regulator of heat shock response
MTLGERQKTILDTVIREYIRTARPVASGELVRQYGFEVSPATLRNEMFALAEMGYLEQPHTSAGRIPTDKGYRFFVDNLPDENDLSGQEHRTLDKLFGIEEEGLFVREFARTMARLSRMVAAVRLGDEDIFYDSGFSEVFREPEFEDLAHVKSFGRLIDFLDEEFERVLGKKSVDDEQIFIGKENPWGAAQEYTMIVSPWRHPRNFQGVLALIGPKRTDYQKHKAIIRYIRFYHE